jgi:hypothetical protein
MDTTAITPEELETEETPEESSIELNANDRCDSCGSQAYVQVFFSSGYLLFCNHHFEENRSQVEEKATLIHNESHRLIQNRSVE